jgi:regulator of protease activity HflC (stomatin/prohibitin superfamily)
MGSHDHEHEEALQEPTGELDAMEEGSEQEAVKAEEAAGAALNDALRVSFTFLKIAMMLLLVWYFAQCLFGVDPGEVKFKLRFGEIVRVGEGAVLKPRKLPHVRWPFEEVVAVGTDEQNIILDKDFWPYEDPTERRSGVLEVRRDGYLLTGDLNVVHMKLRLRYKVSEYQAASYVFAVREPEEILRQMFLAATTKVVGSQRLEHVLQKKATMDGSPKDLFAAIAEELRARLRRFEAGTGHALGVDVTAVEAVVVDKEGYKNPTEPSPVMTSVRKALQAETERDRLEREGLARATSIRTLAEAETSEILSRARADATRLKQMAEAQSAEMQKILPYVATPEEKAILRDQYLQSTLESVMLTTPDAFVFTREPGEIRLEHDRLRPRDAAVPVGR